jgi:hypothetical protein
LARLTETLIRQQKLGREKLKAAQERDINNLLSVFTAVRAFQIKSCFVEKPLEDKLLHDEDGSRPFLPFSRRNFLVLNESCLNFNHTAEIISALRF